MQDDFNAKHVEPVAYDNMGDFVIGNQYNETEARQIFSDYLAGRGLPQSKQDIARKLSKAFIGETDGEYHLIRSSSDPKEVKCNGWTVYI